MPYNITKHDGKYFIRHKGSSKVVATTDSEKNLRGTLWHREHGEGRGGISNDPPGYQAMVQRLEKQGFTTSDAQAYADARFSEKRKAHPLKKATAGHIHKDEAKDAAEFGEGRGKGSIYVPKGRTSQDVNDAISNYSEHPATAYRILHNIKYGLLDDKRRGFNTTRHGEPIDELVSMIEHHQKNLKIKHEGRGSGDFRDYYLADNWMGRGGGVPKGFEHLMSERDTPEELRKEHDYWKNKKGKKNLHIISRPSSEKGVYNTQIYMKKGRGGTPPPGHHDAAFWKKWAREEHKSDTAQKNEYMSGEKAIQREIPSETTPGKTYRVWGEKGNMHCSCPSFTYRNTCKHVQALGEEGPKRKLKYGRNFYYKNE